MREIKFRAWDGSEFIYMDYKSGIWSCGSFKDVQQYTGLKDKNGVEIYEGDVMLDSQGNKWAVKWDINCFTINRLSHLFEVIGNIYENPELLEVK